MAESFESRGGLVGETTARMLAKLAERARTTSALEGTSRSVAVERLTAWPLEEAADGR